MAMTSLHDWCVVVGHGRFKWVGLVTGYEAQAQMGWYFKSG